MYAVNCFTATCIAVCACAIVSEIILPQVGIFALLVLPLECTVIKACSWREAASLQLNPQKYM